MTTYKERLDNSLKKAKDPDMAEHLRFIMSNISEDRWCAGWLIGLEFELWPYVNGEKTPPEDDWGLRDMSRLKRISEKAGGWWMWVGEGVDSGEVFLTTEEWEPIYKKYKALVDSGVEFFKAEKLAKL